MYKQMIEDIKQLLYASDLHNVAHRVHCLSDNVRECVDALINPS